MAVVQLGAIVTGLAGSVGGTTFRRNRNSLIMSNKSRGHVPSPIKNSSSISQLSRLAYQWSQLSPSVRSAWNEAAPDYGFPNRFGGLGTLTGRQLFYKLMSEVNYLDLDIPNPVSMNRAVTTILVTLDNDTFSSQFPITISTDAGNVWVLFQARQLRDSESLGKLRRYKKLAGFFIEDTDHFTLRGLLLNQFGAFTQGDRFQLFFTPVNQFGFRGSTVTLELVVRN